LPWLVNKDSESAEEVRKTRDKDDPDGDDDEVPQQVAELAEAKATVPDSLRGIRACKRCGLLKTMGQFMDNGCENCPFLNMVDNADRVNMCVTPFFEGQVAVMDPRESWAAKWIRVDSYLPGIYAISVTGQFDREIEEDLENRGLRWRCRPSQ